MTKAPTASHAVKVSLAVLWKVKIDHHIDTLNVDATGEEICKTITMPHQTGLNNQIAISIR